MEDADEDFERAFYLMDEEGAIDMESFNPFIGDEKKFAEFEAKMDAARRKGDAKLKGMSAKKAAILADQEAWETDRLVRGD